MFALIYNNQIEVGPRNWHMPMFREFLTDNDLASEITLLPVTAPTEIIQGTGWKIFPARIVSSEPYDAIFEQPVGPNWVIEETEVVGTYTTQPAPIETAKSHLRSLVESTRYIHENGNLIVTIDDILVQIPTNREQRGILLTGAAGKWKFKKIEYISTNTPAGAHTTPYITGDVWLTINAETLYIIQTLIRDYIQECFDWEAAVTTDINNAASIAELQDINLTFVSAINVNG